MSLEAKIRAVRGAMPDILKKVAREFNQDFQVNIEAEMEIRTPNAKNKKGKAIYESPISSNILGIRDTADGLYKSFFSEIKDGLIFLDSKKPYAAVHEFGSTKKNIQKRPYIKPAIEEMNKGDFRQRLTRTIFTELSKVWLSA